MANSDESSQPHEPAETTEKPAVKTKRKKKAEEKKGLLGGAAEIVPVLILGYAAYIGRHFYANLYPTFPDFDANHNYLEKFGNKIGEAEPLSVHVFVKESKTQPVIARDATPIWKFDLNYSWDGFIPSSTWVQANVSQKLLEGGRNVWISARLVSHKGDRIAEAHGKTIKYSNMKPLPTKYWLLSGDICDDGREQTYGTKKKPQIARGVPQMQIRIVFDRTLYPRPWMHSHYLPMMYVDEFWLTDDQLIKFNRTGDNQFGVQTHVSLMSAARWRFQTMMDHSFTQNAKIFGENSEEMLAMRDLFANTHPYLLIATLVVSILHTVFEYLALKNDVQFWNKTDAQTLSKFVSLRSVFLEILCNLVLMIYLYDQDANFLVLILSLGQVLVDCWKVTRVVEISFQLKFGFIPCPSFKTKVPRTNAEDFDKIALTYLSYILVPIIIGYAFYSASFECHKSWVSYVLHASASLVYALGFALMTPQLFINYRLKSVANLPWRRFIYRAINTFIDDLFSFIIKMPTMHRMSCFRDDAVFIVYLYQRHIYPVDKNRNFDEDMCDDDAGEGEGESKKAK